MDWFSFKSSRNTRIQNMDLREEKPKVSSIYHAVIDHAKKVPRQRKQKSCSKNKRIPWQKHTDLRKEYVFKMLRKTPTRLSQVLV